MKFLVTGATGLIGSRLVHRLSNEGHDVSILVRSNSDISELEGLKLKRFTGDITKIDTIYPALKRIDGVFHTAGFVKQWGGYKDTLYRINVLGARNVLKASLRKGAQRVVAVSSAVAVGITNKPEVIDETFPFNLSHLPYAKSKWLFEKEAARLCQKGLDVVIVNPVTVFGAGDINFNAGKILINTIKGKYLGYPAGGTTVVDVEDVVSGMMVAFEKGRKGERYILGNEHISFRSLLEQTAKVVGAKPPKIKLPSFFIKTIALANETMSLISHRVPYPSLPAAEMSVKYMYCNSQKAKRELDYTPKTDLKQSIRNTYNWYLKRGYV